MSIQKVAEMCGFKLRPEQKERAKVVEWLLRIETPETPEERGRTTLLALGFIDLAVTRPDTEIHIFDHLSTFSPGPSRQIAMVALISLIRDMPEEVAKRFTLSPDKGTILYK